MTPSWYGRALMIVPTYNERENLARLVGRLRALPGDIHLLIVDDGSPDGTGAIADAIAACDPHVHVLHRRGKLGLGTAYRAGFHYGIAARLRLHLHDGRRFQPQPGKPARAARSGGVRLRPGDRQPLRAGRRRRRLARRCASSSAMPPTRWRTRLLDVAARDCTAGFRCYRRQVLETIDRRGHLQQRLQLS
jgi:dolichol-phosphate mannosyltransferase